MMLTRVFGLAKSAGDRIRGVDLFPSSRRTEPQHSFYALLFSFAFSGNCGRISSYSRLSHSFVIKRSGHLILSSFQDVVRTHEPPGHQHSLTKNRVGTAKGSLRIVLGYSKILGLGHHVGLELTFGHPRTFQSG